VYKRQAVGEDPKKAVTRVAFSMEQEAHKWMQRHRAELKSWEHLKTCLREAAKIGDQAEEARSAMRQLTAPGRKAMALEERAALFALHLDNLPQCEKACTGKLYSDFIYGMPESQVSIVVQAVAAGMPKTWEAAYDLLKKIKVSKEGYLPAAAAGSGAVPMELGAVCDSRVCAVSVDDSIGGSSGSSMASVSGSYKEVADSDGLSLGESCPKDVEAVTVNLVSGERTYHSRNFQSGGRPAGQQQGQGSKPQGKNGYTSGGGNSGSGGGKGQAIKKPSNPKPTDVCGRCGGKGHWARDCATPNSGK
jgi:hypothetical protein